MKLLTMFLLAGAMFTGLCAVTGCETTHTEKDTPGLLGGNTHESTDVTHNDITGGTSVQKSTTSTQ